MANPGVYPVDTTTNVGKVRILTGDMISVPLVSLKDPRHFSVAGGSLAPLDGSFELDDVEARVRHVVGAATIAPQIVVASTGAAA